MIFLLKNKLIKNSLAPRGLVLVQVWVGGAVSVLNRETQTPEPPLLLPRRLQANSWLAKLLTLIQEAEKQIHFHRLYP